MTYPEALRLADALDSGFCPAESPWEMSQAAAELRRLYEENQRCKQVCAATAEGWRQDTAKPVQAESTGKQDLQVEPVQKPVAWQWLDTAHFRKKIPADATPSHWRPLYTAPPQRKPMTEEEIEKAYREIWRNLPSDFDHTSSGWIEQGIRYAERAHGIGGQYES